jgi:ribosomal subunit interface protein
MHLEVTFRNLSPREEVRKRADALFAKLHRFLDPASDAQLNVGVEHGKGIVELVCTSHGNVHKASEEDEDLRTALDRAFHTMETQLRRSKERRIDRHRGPGDAEDGFVGADEEGEVSA